MKDMRQSQAIFLLLAAVLVVGAQVCQCSSIDTTQELTATIICFVLRPSGRCQLTDPQAALPHARAISVHIDDGHVPKMLTIFACQL